MSEQPITRTYYMIDGVTGVTLGRYVLAEGDMIPVEFADMLNAVDTNRSFSLELTHADGTVRMHTGVQVRSKETTFQ